MKKKLISILLCMSMVTTLLAGCSSGAEETAISATEEEVSKESEANGSANQAETGTLDTLDIFINMSWYPVDSFTGIIPEYIKEATGVDLNVTIATDSSQLGVMIGSGEVPDLVFTDVELDRLSNNKICYSYTELEEKFGASFSEVNEERKAISRNLSEDGDYYTLLNAYSTKEEWNDMKIGASGQPCIFYRKDLVEKMGVSEIKTVEDFIKVLGQCKETYPDMLPYGLGGVWKFQPIEGAMGVLFNQYNPETGDYYYEASAPGYKDFLKTANQMARNGYVSAESYANENEADGHQAAYNNGCIFYPWYLGYSNLVQLQTESKKINPDAEWDVLPKLGEFGTVGTSRGWAGTFVSKNCSNPEAASRLLTYLNTQEGIRTSLWGKEGVDYTMREDGVPEFSDEVIEARANNTRNEKYNPLFYLGATSAVQETYSSYAGLDDSILEPFSTYGKGYINYAAVGIAKPNSSTDEGVIYNKMEEIRKSYEAKVIFAASDEEFENSYQEFMDALEKTGLSQYNDYMKQAIAEVNKELGFK